MKDKTFARGFFTEVLMKKLRIVLIALVLALAAVGVAACTGETSASEHTVTFQIAGGGND